MRRALAFTLFCSVAAASLVGQPLGLQGSRIALPEGSIIGAALSDNLIFIQQSVRRADSLSIRLSRRLLSWTTETNSVVKERTLDASDFHVENDCGRIETVDGGNHLLACANYDTLVMLDAESLEPVSSIHCDGHIYDFAVDDNLKRVLVALRSGSGVQFLTMFDIVSGKQLEQTKISSGALENIQIALDSRTKRVAIAESHLEHSGYKTSLYGCSYMQVTTCQYVVTLQQVSQIAIWGPEVFLASGLLADDRRVCLTTVNLSSRAMARQYCAPRTGVHYGVGVIEGKYVVGFTGVAKSSASKEMSYSVKNSVSVWRYENGAVAAEAVQEGADASFPGVQIACSKTRPSFLLYSQTSNIAHAYSVNDADLDAR
jgi:hypothetical protein